MPRKKNVEVEKDGEETSLEVVSSSEPASKKAEEDPSKSMLEKESKAVIKKVKIEDPSKDVAKKVIRPKKVVKKLVEKPRKKQEEQGTERVKGSTSFSVSTSGSASGGRASRISKFVSDSAPASRVVSKSTSKSARRSIYPRQKQQTVKKDPFLRSVSSSKSSPTSSDANKKRRHVLEKKTVSESQKEAPSHRHSKVYVLVFFLTLLLGGALAFGVLYFENIRGYIGGVSEETMPSQQEQSEEFAHPASEEKEKPLWEKVKEIVVTPDEEPVIVTVSDVDVFREEQSLYKRIQNGDKILLFAQEEEAIIYRPQEHKIINMGPLDIADLPGSENFEGGTDSQGKNEEVTFDIRNGSGIAGYAKKTASVVEERIENIDVATVGNANRRYDTTMIVVLSGDISEETLGVLEESLEDSTVTKEIPDGEDETDADILILLGS